jgi:hypothetical protein
MARGKWHHGLDRLGSSLLAMLANDGKHCTEGQSGQGCCTPSGMGSLLAVVGLCRHSAAFVMLE